MKLMFAAGFVTLLVNCVLIYGQMVGGGSWVFFSATFSAGGSGTLTRLAILEYQSGEGKSGALVNLLPYVGLTNVSQHALWTVPNASPYPLLIVADFIWGSGETHFPPHHYAVEAWRFRTDLGAWAGASRDSAPT
jgi:hypothetical protein